MQRNASARSTVVSRRFGGANGFLFWSERAHVEENFSRKCKSRSNARDSLFSPLLSNKLFRRSYVFQTQYKIFFLRKIILFFFDSIRKKPVTISFLQQPRDSIIICRPAKSCSSSLEGRLEIRHAESKLSIMEVRRKSVYARYFRGLMERT